jgi:archaellum component FlaG (FlaF/FlaG flagellin family)
MKKMAVFLFLLTVLLSCSNGSKWYPEGTVTIAAADEYTDITGSTGIIVTLTIHNTGSTSILASTVTVKVVTDGRTYLQSAASAIKIIPGGTIALPVQVPYLVNTERVVPNGATVYAAFFD